MTEMKPGRARLTLALSILLVFVVSFSATVAIKLWPELTRPKHVDPAFRIPSPLELASIPTATHFDFPLGNENGAMAYNAQHFTENHHLGDDLNGIGGENSDLGDPIFAIADGRVLLTRDGGPGWGNVVILLHAYIDHDERKYVQSYYGHVQDMLVHPGETVKRGQQIATVGTANGRYFAHLHFEMREFITPFIGPGYREDTRGWIDGTKFIEQHR
jgi:Peptidase family M23